MVITIPPTLAGVLTEQFEQLKTAGKLKANSLEEQLIFSLVDLHYQWVDLLLDTPQQKEEVKPICLLPVRM